MNMHSFTECKINPFNGPSSVEANAFYGLHRFRILQRLRAPPAELYTPFILLSLLGPNH